MSTQLGRIIRLEERLGSGCPHCRAWNAMVIESEDGFRSRPERCPVCQREVPIGGARRYIGVDPDAV